MTAFVAGHRLKFCTFQAFSLLFKDVFLTHDYFFNSASERPHIIDCGSNIGMSVLYFKLIYPQANIVAFEPDPQAFACLEENVRANQFADVRLMQNAVTCDDGPLTFYYDQDNPGSPHMSTLAERMPKAQRTVMGVRLSSFIDREVDFLKMDIEGAETKVLQEVAAAGKLRLVREMVIEYHHHIAKQTDDFSQLLVILEQQGFGYQLSANGRPRQREAFQDVLIYVYRKQTV
jgi:FkbM family methyltransferase